MMGWNGEQHAYKINRARQARRPGGGRRAATLTIIGCQTTPRIVVQPRQRGCTGFSTCRGQRSAVWRGWLRTRDVSHGSGSQCRGCCVRRCRPWLGWLERVVDGRRLAVVG